MGMVYTPIYMDGWFFMVNVGKHIPYMDAMGMTPHQTMNYFGQIKKFIIYVHYICIILSPKNG